MDYFFEFNLETGKVSKDTNWDYAVRYYNSENGPRVEIGNYRYDSLLLPEHWNRILRIIKDEELDQSGIEAIIRGLMGCYIPTEYEDNFISAIKAGIIKEIK